MFVVATTYFFVTHMILLRSVNFYVKYFFDDTIVFCATQDFFVLPIVSIKNIVNKYRCLAIKKICKRHAVLHLLARFSSFREIKHGYLKD